MPKQPTLQVETRTVTGRSVKKLRRENILPANIYGKKVESQSVQIKSKDFNTVYQQVGETGLLDLVVGKDKKTRPVLITNVHKNPVTDAILHVDFHQVDLTQKVTTTIPLEYIGESAAVKDLGGVLNKAFLEVEVEALPTDLPENIEVDISSLKEIGDSLHVKDIKVPSKVSLLLDKETLLVSTQEQKEEEPEPAPVADEPEAGDEDTDEEAGKEPDSKPAKPADTKEGKPDEKTEEKPKEEK